MPRYTARRTDYQAKDLVKCTGCGKMTLRKTATEVTPGVWYGSNCVMKAAAALESAHRNEQLSDGRSTKVPSEQVERKV